MSLWTKVRRVLFFSPVFEYLIPRQEDPEKVSPGEVSAPTLQEGSEILVLFGSRVLNNPAIVWWGDVDTRAVGSLYQYDVGLHMVLCHGPVDYIKTIKIDKKILWSGYNSGGLLEIDETDFFGGTGKGGGVSGDLRILMGLPTQTANAYLATTIGTDMPAFRGVVSVVAEQMYLGDSPSLRGWTFDAQRILTVQNGEDQWNIDEAPISISSRVAPLAIYMMLDFGDSMNDDGKYDEMVSIVEDMLDYLLTLLAEPDAYPIDIKVVGFGAVEADSISLSSSITERNLDATGVSNIKAWFPATADQTGDFAVAAVLDEMDFVNGVVNGAEIFYDGAPTGARKLALFISDGELDEFNTYIAGSWTPADAMLYASYYLFSIPNVISHAFLIGSTDDTLISSMDNTPLDGVPTITSTDYAALISALTNTLSANVDLNPIHIVRECLTDSNWGSGYASTNIDATSFEACSTTIFEEQFGISILWSDQKSIDDFITEILRHIDAVLYTSRETGKFVIKLIRDDYTVEDLDTLDPTNVKKITNFTRQVSGELINSVNINYWDNATGNTASYPLQNAALVQMQGAEITSTIVYKGITNEITAAKVAIRDLTRLSTPLISCTVETNQIAADYNIGDVFILNWPDYYVDNVVMRIDSISFGNGVSNSIKITAVQDIYGRAAADPGPTYEPVQGTLAAGYWHTIGVKTDNTLRGTGANTNDQLEVDTWEDIIAVSAFTHSLGLKSDLTVVAAGDNSEGENNVSTWSDIVSISAGWQFSVGLKSNGTVVAVGLDNYGQSDVSSWAGLEIVAIAAGGRHTLGLKSDGTVVAVGDNTYGQTDVSSWEGIQQIRAGGRHSVGLKSDGTVVAVGRDNYGQSDVSSWASLEIVSIGCGYNHTLGIKSDGTVVAVGDGAQGQTNVSGLSDVIAIDGGNAHTVYQVSDGEAGGLTMLPALDYGQADLFGWVDILIEE